MYKFLYEILPRYITAFTKCTGEMGTVRKILAEKEVRAWYSFNGMIPSQNLAYLYCQDMLSVKTTDAKDLNLCETCDKHTASHPPNTCSLVTPKLSLEFSALRAKHKVGWENEKLSYDRSPKQMAITKVKIENINTY